MDSSPHPIPLPLKGVPRSLRERVFWIPTFMPIRVFTAARLSQATLKHFGGMMAKREE
jgi:hypothetical protein